MADIFQQPAQRRAQANQASSSDTQPSQVKEESPSRPDVQKGRRTGGEQPPILSETDLFTGSSRPSAEPPRQGGQRSERQTEPSRRTLEETLNERRQLEALLGKLGGGLPSACHWMGQLPALAGDKTEALDGEAVRRGLNAASRGISGGAPELHKVVHRETVFVPDVKSGPAPAKASVVSRQPDAAAVAEIQGAMTATEDIMVRLGAAHNQVSALSGPDAVRQRDELQQVKRQVADIQSGLRDAAAKQLQ